LGKVWGHYGQGYGTVRPSTISNGGDTTSLVRDVVWQSWGGSTATGTGTAVYVAPDQITADGTEEQATVVAFNLGTSQGTLMYQAVEWYFPQQGETFDPNNYLNTSTGTYVGPLYNSQSQAPDNTPSQSQQPQYAPEPQYVPAPQTPQTPSYSYSSGIQPNGGSGDTGAASDDPTDNGPSYSPAPSYSNEGAPSYSSGGIQSNGGSGDTGAAGDDPTDNG
jgi:hypothetical protein